ncbi:hypothetical protein [Arthrobacter sp. NPDC089319]|uniref:hypothetical protein n=1 Tax=Arthrobacter sp. NPDC089319 TaxID=3155915 RepID=UPI00342ADC09
MPESKSPLGVPLTVGTVAAVIYGLKILLLASGDVATAVEIAGMVDFIPTVTQIALSVTPTLALPLAVWFAYSVRAQSDLDPRPIHIATTLFLCATVMYSSGWVLLAALAYLGLHMIYKRGTKRKWRRDVTWMRFRFELAQPILIGILMPALISGQIWLTPQALTHEGRTATVFVVSTTDTETFYISRDDNLLHRVSNASIESLNYCSRGFSFMADPLIFSLSKKADYPDCESAASAAVAVR